MTDTTAVSRTASGVAFAALSTSIGGATVVLMRYCIEQTDPLTLSALRYVIGGAVLTAIVFGSHRLPRLVRREWAILFALAIIMYVAFPILGAKAVEYTTAGRAGLVYATNPLVTVIVGALIGVERLRLNKIAAVVVAGSGMALALSHKVGDALPDAWIGDALMFVTVLLAVSHNFIARPLLFRHGGLVVATIALTLGGIIMVPMTLLFAPPLSQSLAMDTWHWLALLGLAIPGGAMMNVIWAAALARILPSQATITIGLNPLVAILLGALMLGEELSYTLLGGFVLVVAGIVMSNYEALRPRRPPARPAI
ncbi:MAG: DMT family transporter [Alphaproteobacteria bacterium]